MNMKNWTRILATVETREALKLRKRGGESYDAVIRRLMKEAEV